MRQAIIGACLLLCGCAGEVEPDPELPCVVIPATSCPTKNVWEQACNPWLLTAPKVHLVFWGNWWVTNTTGNSQAVALSEEWQTLANDPNFYAPMVEYGIGAGKLDGIFYSNWNLPNSTISYQYVEDQLQSETASGELPAPDNQSIYVFLLPSTTTDTVDVSNHFAGYHAHVGQTTYAVIEHDTNDNMSYTISHEIAEAATDPDPVSGWCAGNGESEIADYCDGNSYVLDGYTITQLWNQKTCQCGP
jgi:hypothetical protein